MHKHTAAGIKKIWRMTEPGMTGHQLVTVTSDVLPIAYEDCSHSSPAETCCRASYEVRRHLYVVSLVERPHGEGPGVHRYGNDCNRCTTCNGQTSVIINYYWTSRESVPQSNNLILRERNICPAQVIIISYIPGSKSKCVRRDGVSQTYAQVRSWRCRGKQSNNCFTQRNVVSLLLFWFIIIYLIYIYKSLQR